PQARGRARRGGARARRPRRVAAARPARAAGRRRHLDAARARGAPAPRAGPRQQGDRGPPRRLGSHGQVPRQRDPRQARRREPHRGGRPRREAGPHRPLAERAGPRAARRADSPDARATENDARQENPVSTPTENFAIALSESFASIVETAARSVVRIEAGRRWPASGAVWSTDGTIVTTSHSVEDDEDIEVGFQDGTTLPATLVGRDHGTDLAILKVAATGLARPAWLEPDGLKVGHLVLAVSRPGRTARASHGVVSALADSWRTPAGGKLDRYIESDVALRPGFSGSLLVDASGRVLGLNTSGLLRGQSIVVPT